MEAVFLPHLLAFQINNLETMAKFRWLPKAQRKVRLSIERRAFLWGGFFAKMPFLEDVSNIDRLREMY